MRGKAPFHRRFARDQRITPEIFLRQNFQIMERARHHRGDDDLADRFVIKALQLHQLQQPHRVLIGGAARIGRHAPARADFQPVKQSENNIGVAHVNRKKH